MDRLTGQGATRLDASRGRTIDNLLHAASEGAPDELRALIGWARRGLRSGRPEDDWAWPANVEVRLSELASDEGTTGDRVRDAIAVAKGADLERVRDVRMAPHDPRLELAQFRTTKSFDAIRQRFAEHIDATDSLEVVLRGHLWIESAINTLIEKVAQDPKDALEARLSFAQKLRVCTAFGVVPRDYAPPIRLLNSLRNRLAHNLDAEITEADQASIISACNGFVRHIASLDIDRPVPDGIVQAIAGLVVALHGLIDELDAVARYSEYQRTALWRTIDSLAAGRTTG